MHWTVNGLHAGKWNSIELSLLHAGQIWACQNNDLHQHYAILLCLFNLLVSVLCHSNRVQPVLLGFIEILCLLADWLCFLYDQVPWEVPHQVQQLQLLGPDVFACTLLVALIYIFERIHLVLVAERSSGAHGEFIEWAGQFKLRLLAMIILIS